MPTLRPVNHKIYVWHILHKYYSFQSISLARTATCFQLFKTIFQGRSPDKAGMPYKTNYLNQTFKQSFPNIGLM